MIWWKKRKRKSGLKWESRILRRQNGTQKINNVFDHLSTLIHQDTKTALSQTIQNFKKIVARQWESMGDANMDVILRSIKDPTVVYL